MAAEINSAKRNCLAALRPPLRYTMDPLLAKESHPDEGQSAGLHPITGLVLIALLAGLLASCLFLLAIAAQSPAALKSRLDAMAPDGTADDFPLTRVAGIRHAVMFTSGLCIALIVSLWKTRGLLDLGCRHAAIGLRDALHWAVREGRPIAVPLAIVTALGCFLRASFLGQPMRFDETTTYVEFVSKPLLYGISYYPAPNNHILHTLLAHLVVTVFGSAPWAVRLVAFLAGTIMIPTAAFAALAMRDREAAIPAASLVAVSWPWVFYSANARGYTIAGLIFLILVPICATLLTKRDLCAWLWFAILAALGLFTLPLMAYALVPLALWVLVCRPLAWKELAVATAGAAGLALLLYTPALTASGIAAPTPEMVPSTEHMWARIAQFSIALWRNWHYDLPAWISGAFVCAAAIGWRAGTLTAISAAWYILALAVYPVMPFTRIWLWLSLPWLLLVATGLGRILPWRPSCHHTAAHRVGGLASRTNPNLGLRPPLRRNRSLRNPGALFTRLCRATITMP